MASTSRDRDRGCKYLSGNRKQALAKAKEAENEKLTGIITNFLASPPTKRACIEDEEDRNYSENYNTNKSQTVDDYIHEINKLEKVDTQMNQTEDSLDTIEDRYSESQAQTLHSDGSSASTAVVNINDDPASWPVNINKNMRDYLVMKGHPGHCSKQLSTK